jgi:hypothetical protein
VPARGGLRQLLRPRPVTTAVVRAEAE